MFQYKRTFMGDAYSKTKQRKVGVLMIAVNEEEAAKIYEECIKRHSDIEIIDCPNIAWLLNDEPLIEEIKKHSIVAEELSAFSSCIIQSGPFLMEEKMYKFFYTGSAYNIERRGDISIMIQASDDEEAFARYNECVNRHKNLIAKDNPQICIELNTQGMFDDLFNEAMFKELDEYGSVDI